MQGMPLSVRGTLASSVRKTCLLQSCLLAIRAILRYVYFICWGFISDCVFRFRCCYFFIDKIIMMLLVTTEKADFFKYYFISLPFFVSPGNGLTSVYFFTFFFFPVHRLYWYLIEYWLSHSNYFLMWFTCEGYGLWCILSKVAAFWEL